MPSLIELTRELTKIKELGFIPSSRRGPTGIGHTLEQCLRIRESNIQVPDLGGRVEVKATRRNSSSLITLFTLNRGAWSLPQKKVVEHYGYVDEARERKALYFTVRTKPNHQGLSLHVDKPTNRI